MTFSLRKATVKDAPSIAFMNVSLARESENKELDLALVNKGVVALLEDANKGWYLLACEGDNLIGQLMITYEWSDWRNGWFWWIQSVYVLPGRRGMGVFKALYKEVCSMAKSEENVVGVRLYVEEHNLNAKKVYESMGMKPAGYEVLEMVF